VRQCGAERVGRREPLDVGVERGGGDALPAAPRVIGGGVRVEQQRGGDARAAERGEGGDGVELSVVLAERAGDEDGQGAAGGGGRGVERFEMLREAEIDAVLVDALARAERGAAVAVPVRGGAQAVAVNEGARRDGRRRPRGGGGVGDGGE